MSVSRKNISYSKCLTAGLLLAASHAPASAATTAPSKCDTALRALLTAPKASGWSSVIARLDGDLTPARASQLHGLQVAVTDRLPIIHSVALRVPTRSLAHLAALPFITHLSYDGEVKKCDEFTVGSSGAGAAFQQYGLTGRGVTVAVLDSGVRQGQDLAGGVAGPTSGVVDAVTLIPGNNFDDQCGHGTHVAGIIAGSGAASTGPYYTHTFYGVARQAGIVNVKVLDANGGGNVSTAIAGLQWVVQNKVKDNIRVVNLSLGHPVGESYTTDPLCQAVEAAWKAGIVVVCAAGNDGRLNAAQAAAAPNEGWGTAYGSIQSPANDPYVITVGATKREDSSKADDKIATYSARGPSRLDLVLKPDIVAPGNRVISLYSWGSTLYTWNTDTGNGLPCSSYENTTWGGASSDYFVLSGTSMAAPVVSGAAALLLQKYPSLTPDTVKARLMVSADKWAQPDGTADPCTFGAGYVDIPAALQSSVTVPAGAYALSPTLSQDGQGNVSIGTSALLAANRCIWGSTSLTDLRCVWGSRCIWGTSTNLLSASRCVWGSSVFSDRCVWGSSDTAVDLSSVALNGEK